ncbi:hypothetical protein Q3G72_018618 [Acer saccharum]|nr:hypothetical protein Q3G72_018618 [Acer saccharum]
MQRIESIIHEQRLETTWLQATEKGTAGSLNQLRPEENQVLPQEGIYHQNLIDSVLSSALSSQQWEDELNQELKVLKLNDERFQKDQNGKTADHYPMSPSLLHDTSFMDNFSKENLQMHKLDDKCHCKALKMMVQEGQQQARQTGTHQQSHMVDRAQTVVTYCRLPQRCELQAVWF